MSMEKEILTRLQLIFGMEKVTMDRPGESQEQQGVFVAVENSNVRIIDAREIANISGTLNVFANQDKLPLGYFAKKISEAPTSVKKPFFFGPEENVGTYRNIAQRKMDFTFLFDSQYDPAIGTITEVNLSYSENLG